MEDEPVTTAELLDAWRDTTRAAELTERLARVAVEAAENAEQAAAASEEIAQMAETAAEAAQRAASSAREAARRAHAVASDHRTIRVVQAQQAATESRMREAEAQARYHDATHGHDGPAT